MPIEVTCPECSGRLRVGDTAAGKRVKCPRCARAVAVPPPEAGEAGVGTYAVEDSPTCPGCLRTLSKGAVLCVNCGFDLRSRKKHRTTYRGVSFHEDFGLRWLGTYTRFSFTRERDGDWTLGVGQRLFFLPLGTRTYDLRKYDAAVTDYAQLGEDHEVYSVTLEGPRGRRAVIYRGANPDILSWLTDALREKAGLTIRRG